jgi:hypothetical protein
MHVLFVKFGRSYEFTVAYSFSKYTVRAKKLIKTDTKLVESFFAKVSLAANVLFLAG